MHFVILFNVINFGMGIFVLTLCFNLYLINRAGIFRYLLGIQTLIVFFTANNLLWSYVHANMGDSPVLLLHGPYVMVYVLTMVFCYYFVLFFHSVCRLRINPLLKKAIQLFVILSVVFYVLAIIIIYVNDPGALPSFITGRAPRIVDSVVVALGCYILILSISNYRKIDAFIVKKIIQFFLVIFLASAAVKVLNYCLIDAGLIEDAYIDYQISHFLWNSMCLGIFFIYSRQDAGMPERMAHVSRSSGIQGASQNFAEKVSKYEKSGISDDYGRELFERIERHMKRSRPYADPDLAMQDVADTLSVSRHHLSQAINRYSGKGFNEYINSYRVQEVLNALNDPSRSERKIIELALEAGFNSKSTFNYAFKKHTGMNAQEYRKSRQV